ncbi:nicotinate-nucleotide adenylyltransferase [Aromatoleum sp.]|uniref:nicotinate-nucleotide adenylyltransferase n=1 Tax=Aromatoleum sp. TaxID=2307007 RepID=UPI002FCC61B9
MPRSEAGPLGVFGGTFDPIHLGHLRLAEEARERLDLEYVAFIPAGQPPHRDAPHSTAADRLEMVRRATASNPSFIVDDGEVFAAGKSYTVLTLERLRASIGPERPLVLILGADAFQGLPTWHRWREILQLTHLAVGNRPGHALPDGIPRGMASAELDALCNNHRDNDPTSVHQSPAGRIVPFDMTPLAISASQVRALILAGQSARYLLPEPVLQYIGQHHLYQPI